MDAHLVQKITKLVIQELQNTAGYTSDFRKAGSLTNDDIHRWNHISSNLWEGTSNRVLSSGQETDLSNHEIERWNDITNKFSDKNREANIPLREVTFHHYGS